MPKTAGSLRNNTNTIYARCFMQMTNKGEFIAMHRHTSACDRWEAGRHQLPVGGGWRQNLVTYTGVLGNEMLFTQRDLGSCGICESVVKIKRHTCLRLKPGLQTCVILVLLLPYFLTSRS